MSDYLSPAEAAAVIGMTPNYVQRQCSAGVIPAKKLGTVWRIARVDLDAWMHDGQTAPAARDREDLRSARQRRRSA